MKPLNNLIASLLFFSTAPVWAQTAVDYIAQGENFLAATNLIAANISFSNALTLSPNNQTGNVLYAATRLLVLPQQTVGSNFLSRLGVPIAGRDIYHWTAELPADTNGVPLAPMGVDASELTAALRTNVLPTTIAAEANLAAVTDTNFLLSLSSEDTEMGAVHVDYGDVLLMRAALEAATYFAYTVDSWNLYAQLGALRSLYVSEGLNPGQILSQYPELFTFTTTNDMVAAKVAFSNAVSLYVQASAFIRARPINETQLFNYDLAMSDDESRFRLVLTGLQSALDGAVRLEVGKPYQSHRYLNVNLVPLFDGLHTWRSFIPEFSAESFVLGTLDPTFGSVISGLDLGTAETFIAQHFATVPDFAPGGGFVQNQFVVQLNVLPGRGYAIEASTDLLNWTLLLHEFATNTVITLGDQGAGSQVRFYRAREQPNDRFAEPYVISGFPATALGSNQGATSEPGDPTNYFNLVFGAGNPVWWTWTAPASGEVGISAAGTSFNPVFGVFTGSRLANLVPVQNLAGNSSGSSEFDFQATAGTTYFIAVESGYYFQPGSITLALAGPPSNDFFANRQVLAGTAVSVNGSNILSTEEQNEQFNGGHSVWYSWTAPAAGSVTFSVAGPGYPFATVYSGNALASLVQVPTGYSGGSSTFDAVAGVTYQLQIDGYQTGNFTLGLTLFPGRYPLLLSVYPSEGGNVVLQPQPDTNGMYTAGTSVTLTAQPAPGFVFADWNGAGINNGATPQITLVMNGSQSLQATFQPANDNFANATMLTGASATIDGSTDGASSEPGEPGYSFQTVWYSWTAPGSGSVSFWLGSADQPQLNIYTGNEITNLNPVSIFSYGGSRGVTSQTFDAAAGTTYRIQIGGYCPSFNLLFNLSAGFYTLSDSSSPLQGGTVVANPPPSTNGLYAAGTTVTLEAQPGQGFVFVGWDGTTNSSVQLGVSMNTSQRHFALFHVANDDFANRTVLAGSNITLIGSTAGASGEAGESCIFCQTVWYSWTAIQSGIISLSLTDSGPVQLTVYTGGQLTNLVPISFVSKGGTGSSSTAIFDVVSGTSYQIQIDGYANAFSLGLDFIPEFYALEESIFPTGSGSITANPAPSANGLFAAGTTVGLTAIPKPGWNFASWTGAATGTNTTTPVVMSKSQFVQASFRIAPVYSGLVENGGFETGDFTGWTQSATPGDLSVTNGNLYSHSGTFGLQAGPTGAEGYLSQTLQTVAGKSYSLSFWLDSPDGQTPNEFTLFWNGNVIFDENNVPAIGWTNFQFSIVATGTNTVLKFGVLDDPSYLGIDDISVVAP